MIVSEHFYEFLKDAEGYDKFVYMDSGGAPTIGIGHKLTQGERISGKIKIDGVSVRFVHGLTHEQVVALCNQDIKKSISSVNKLVKVILSQNQFDTLVSFVFNIGATAFESSTLLRRLNAGMYDEVPYQLKRWVYDNGKIVDGLINRRAKEINLWRAMN